MVPLVVSRGNRIEATAMVRDGQTVMLRIRPGRYRVNSLTSNVCTTTKMVTRAPLQSIVIRCP